MITKTLQMPYSLPDAVFQIVNAGGNVKDVRICPAEWLEPIDLKADGSMMVEHLRLKEGCSWMLLSGVHKTVTWMVAASKNDHGLSFEHSFGLEMAKTRPNLMTWLNRYLSVPMAVLFIDRNGFGRLIGTAAEPALMAMTATTGPTGGKNMAKISLVCSTTDNIGYFVGTADDTAALISAMDEGLRYKEEIDALIERMEALEELVISGVVWRLFTYIFEPNYILDLTDFVPDLSKNIELMVVILNGVTINVKLATELVFGDFDDAIVVRGTPTKVHFNSDTVGLVDENIVKLLVKIG